MAQQHVAVRGVGWIGIPMARHLYPGARRLLAKSLEDRLNLAERCSLFDDHLAADTLVPPGKCHDGLCLRFRPVELRFIRRAGITDGYNRTLFGKACERLSRSC